MMKIDERVIDVINEMNGFEKFICRICVSVKRHNLRRELVFHNNFDAIEKIKYVDAVEELLR